MPLLAAFLGSAFTAVLNWFLQFFTRKVAIYATVITTLGTLTAALLVTFNGIIQGITQSVPGDAAWIMFYIPENASQCLAAYSAAALAKWVYDWNTDIVTKSLL
ncbi:ABC transporter permease [Novimethylophilus kurashikiensis]|uniref:ABC transporter permease n=1 Tax=Novimethylophilus kurashikiensis TaxID=1825523 RepID=A0A2R5FG25_9PROT|nr:DUF5455 family protein [Novimethylophilus kurashikiensis]GBG15204.1 ABC transporter permease [Novimethylophilus kurashikiensis]